MLILLVLPSDSSFMMLVLHTITYRLENKQEPLHPREIAFGQSLQPICMECMCLDVQLRCIVNKRQFSGHGPPNTWQYSAQPPSYVKALVLGTGKQILICISKT